MNYNKKYIDIIKKQILKLVSGNSVRIFLFGSMARGDYSQGSDIDIGIEGISEEDFLRVKRDFNVFWENSIVPNNVDLVFFSGKNNEFENKAKQDAVLWKAG